MRMEQEKAREWDRKTLTGDMSRKEVETGIE